MNCHLTTQYSYKWLKYLITETGIGACHQVYWLLNPVIGDLKPKFG